MTSRSASDLEAFEMLSQHPKWVYCANKHIERVAYCIYDLNMEKSLSKKEVHCTFVIKLLGKRSLEKKIRASTGFEPVTSAIPVRCSTN